MASSKNSTLSKERVSSQLNAIELLQAMYPNDGEVMIDDATKYHLIQLHQWAASMDESNDTKVSIPSMLSFVLNVKLDELKNDNEDARLLQLSIEVPIHTTTAHASNTGPLLNIRLRQPTWLSRAQTSYINESTMAITMGLQDDTVGVIEHLRDETQKALASSSSAVSVEAPQQNGLLVRVWFYFPSLSTRTKRADLVQYADIYGLTGFVLAGKPGILCLEGSAKGVDEYMRTIKTESWGDIPSHHKKVSERYRQVLSDGRGEIEQGERVFHDMQEITEAEWMGARRGERGNRSDMGVLEGWLAEKGLAGALEKVLQM